MPDGSTPLIPTISDTLHAQSKISSEVLAVSYSPTTKTTSTNGELSFGGVDTSKFSGEISYAPLTTTSPSSYYWGIDQTITYGAMGTPILTSTAGIVDTGTTLVLLATDAYARYATATGATPDTATGLLTISAVDYAKLQSLYFTIGSAEFELTANAQTWPRALNTYIGGKTGAVYLVIGDVRSFSSESPLLFSDTMVFSLAPRVDQALTSSMATRSSNAFTPSSIPRTAASVLRRRSLRRRLQINATVCFCLRP